MSSQNAEEDWFVVEPRDPPNEGILFVDHAAAGRSGHLGHALVEYAPGGILAFFANCSAYHGGHSGDGWMEYRRSEDGGRTWGEPSVLDYSRAVYEGHPDHSVMCEKAVLADDGAIILFNLECRGKKWQPLAVPTYLRSIDGGLTWQPARVMGDHPGRIWDAMVHEGCIMALELCNDSKVAWYGNLPEHHYALYVSTDNGQTFARRSVLPFEFEKRGYGTMAILPDGNLVVYVYNQADEKHLDYVTSVDGGHTWSDVQTSYMAKQIRNPQMAAFKQGYVLHGRSGNRGAETEKGHFVLYASRDGLSWDAGRYLRIRQAGLGAYSNNVSISGPDRLLIQASHAYEEDKTSVFHWWLT